MPNPSSLSKPALLQWLCVVLAAGAAGQLFHFLHIPAGLFLGPMLAGIACGLLGVTIRVHRHAFRFGQGCVGVLVAHSITWPVIQTLAQSWYQMLGVTALTLAMSALVGLGAIRFSAYLKQLQLGEQHPVQHRRWWQCRKIMELMHVWLRPCSTSGWFAW